MSATSNYEHVQRLLARAAVIQHACDLDLLIFLHRHPRTLLTTEQLATFVGYDLKNIAKALDAFLAAGMLRRVAQESQHAARLFLLLLDGSHGPGLRALLDYASTKAGRQGIIEALNAGLSPREQARGTPKLRVYTRANAKGKG